MVTMGESLGSSKILLLWRPKRGVLTLNTLFPLASFTVSPMMVRSEGWGRTNSDLIIGIVLLLLLRSCSAITVVLLQRDDNKREVWSSLNLLRVFGYDFFFSKLKYSLNLFQWCIQSYTIPKWFKHDVYLCR